MEFEPNNGESKEKEKKSTEYLVDEYNGTYYLTPKDAESVEAFLSVDRQTKAAIRERFGIRVRNDWECYTIAAIYLHTLVAMTMEKSKRNFGKTESLLFYDMLIISSSFKQNMRAEKTSSFNVVINIGDAVEKIISDMDNFWSYGNVDPRAFFFPEEISDDASYDIKTMKRVDEMTRIVSYKKHRIMISDKYSGLVTAVAYTFFEMAFKCIIHKIMSLGDSMVTEKIIMGEYADINAYIGPDRDLKITVIPGPITKRLSKDDHTSESENAENIEE